MLQCTKGAIWLSSLALVAGLVGIGGCQTTSSAGEDDRASEKPRSTADWASALPNGASLSDDIVTAAQPSRDQLEAAARHFQTIVNLRPHDEEGAWDESDIAGSYGAKYVHIPIAGPADLTRDEVATFDDALREAERPILVHCSSSNRVGALFALRAYWLQEKSVDESLELGRQTGLTRLEEAVRQRMLGAGG